MVFVENEKSNWNKSAEEMKHVELEWANNNEDIDTNRDLIDEHNNEHVNSIKNASSSSIHEEAPQNSDQERSRKKSAWLQDYVTNEELFKEEEE